MDTATQLALRAIVSGLRHSGAIDDGQVQAITLAVAEAMDARSAGQREQYHLGELAAGLARDADIDCPVVHSVQDGTYRRKR